MRWNGMIAIGIGAALLSPATAKACVLIDSVFLANRPQRVPDGTVLIRVDVPEIPRNQTSHEVVVKVIDGGQQLRSGELLQVDAEETMRCAKWGRVGVPAYVIGVLRRGADAMPVLTAIGYVDSKPRVPTAELDSYIVDPVVKQQADADRKAHD